MAAEDIDGYLASLEEPKRSTLEALRRSILDVVPEVCRESLFASRGEVDPRNVAVLGAAVAHDEAQHAGVEVGHAVDVGGENADVAEGDGEGMTNAE
jgi:hypothetical protein